MATIHLGKEEVGVGIDGRLNNPVRLTLGDLGSSFGIKTADAHKLIAFLEEHPIVVLKIESTRGSLEAQWADPITLAIENMDDSMLMVFTTEGSEELLRLLKLTVPKLQAFIEKNFDTSVKEKTDNNLRGVFE